MARFVWSKFQVAVSTGRRYNGDAAMPLINTRGAGLNKSKQAPKVDNATQPPHAAQAHVFPRTLQTNDMAGDKDTLLGMGFDSARVECSPISHLTRFQ
jgi:hypothetical protein